MEYFQCEILPPILDNILMPITQLEFSILLYFDHERLLCHIKETIFKKGESINHCQFQKMLHTSNCKTEIYIANSQNIYSAPFAIKFFNVPPELRNVRAMAYISV